MSEEPKEGVRSFTRMLDHIGYGQAQIDLSQELHTVVGQLLDHSQRHDVPVKGKMKVTLDLEVEPHGELRITVGSSHTVSKPKSHGSTAWLSDGGNVTFENPRQTSLPLTEVIDKTTGEVHDVNQDGSDQ